MSLKKAYYGNYYDIRRKRLTVLALVIITIIIIVSIVTVFIISQNQVNVQSLDSELLSIPKYNGEISVEINGNTPFFKESDYTQKSNPYFSPLDKFGRCGPAKAIIGKEMFPTEERGPIGMIKPSGWKTVRYDDIIEDKYLYNRCHLIAYMLCGENANINNLITGTRYFNIKGMLPFESKTADYINSTGNHVLYRVTPFFEGNNLVATGILMEAISIEDNGKGLKFNVFVFNIQPGIQIDYSTGDSIRVD